MKRMRKAIRKLWARYRPVFRQTMVQKLIEQSNANNTVLKQIVLNQDRELKKTREMVEGVLANSLRVQIERRDYDLFVIAVAFSEKEFEIAKHTLPLLADVMSEKVRDEILNFNLLELGVCSKESVQD